MSQPLQRFRHVFSGKASKDLWKTIKRVKNGKTNWALYYLGCCCQDLESQVRALENRLAVLEDK